MVDAIKLAAKIAVIAVVTGLAIALFAGVIFPEISLVPLEEAVGHGKAIIGYWFPELGVWFGFGVILLGLRLSILAFKLGAIAFRWIMRVND